MSDFDDVRQALVGAFKTAHEAANPTVPIAYENVKFDQPVGLPWVAITIIQGQSKRMELSATRIFRHEGSVSVTIAVPEDTGTLVANDLAQDAFEIFADVDISLAGGGKVTTYRAEVLTRGLVEGWYCLNMIADFRSDMTL